MKKLTLRRTESLKRVRNPLMRTFGGTMSLAIVGMLVVLILPACSSSPKYFGGSSSSGQFEMRKYQEKVLPNGLHILYLEDNALPRVGIQMMINSGSAQDKNDELGLSNLMLSLIDQGNGDRSAIQVGDAFAELGSGLGKTITGDTLGISTAGLSKTRIQLLQLFSSVILSPNFKEAELERKRSQILAEIQQKQDQPTEYASELMDEVTYAGHPYAYSTEGELKTVQRLSRTQVIKAYYQHFRPQNAIIAVTGNFDQDFKEELEKTFSTWTSRKAEANTFPMPSATSQPAKILVGKSGLKQAQIRFAQLMIPRNHPDFLKLRLANVVLGGAFASRLNQKIRDEMGLTYSIHSQLDARADGGSFEISTFSRFEKTAEVVKQTEVLVNEFAEKGITEKELDSAKALLIGQFPMAIETTDRLVNNVMLLRRFGVSENYLKDFLRNVDGISLKEVNAAIRQHYKPSQLRVLVYADPKETLDSLKALGNWEVRKAE